MRTFLDRIEHEVRGLVQAPAPPDDELADIIGRLTKISASVNTLKRDLMAELDHPVEGESYRIAVGRKADRSYNPSALIAGFAREGWGIPDLVKADAVRLGWRWTELKRAAYEAGVTLTVAPKEIDDGDEAMIGEVWTDDYRVEGK
jgi:hypothetical protein